ncbi:hypothetical protein F4809DRAFT_453304 [Biscogniauxia mediterranea]|nr:hypothetical protein F4809DRAFT_453304 [Biscogniauxia mediterranea]
MPASAEVQAATLNKFIEGWGGWTPEGFLASWHGDCTTKTLPFSAEVPIRTRAETESVFPMMMSFVTNFQLTVHNIVHDVAHSKAAIYATAKADTPFGPYTNEHALFLWFDETGQKVSKIEEMFDSDAMKDFLPKFERYTAQLKGSS